MVRMHDVLMNIFRIYLYHEIYSLFDKSIQKESKVLIAEKKESFLSIG